MKERVEEWIVTHPVSCKKIKHVLLLQLIIFIAPFGFGVY